VNEWLREDGTPRPEVVVVALGGNLGTADEIVARFDQAIARLSRSWGPARVSPWYRSAPVGAVLDQPVFLNGVAAWKPAAPPAPEEALAQLHEIEAEMGRERSVVGGPRTLDLDLLFVGTQERTGAGIELPHPRMVERAFVLRPLADLFGSELRVRPGEPALGELLQRPAVAAQELELRQ
jgi:2-amino-4-hydroxy-6-hydroxymethyldihydropteridine diphosphokinase